MKKQNVKISATKRMNKFQMNQIKGGGIDLNEVGIHLTKRLSIG